MQQLLGAHGEVLQIGRCSDTHLDEIMELQAKICQEMRQSATVKAEWFVETAREENSRFLIQPNVIYGVFAGDRLVAYASLAYPGGSSDNLAWDLGWDALRVAKSAILDTIVVDSEYRGMGLQRMLIRQCEKYAKETLSANAILTTVAPDNLYSLRNVCAEQFEILLRKEKYGGFERFILGKQ